MQAWHFMHMPAVLSGSSAAMLPMGQTEAHFPQRVQREASVTGLAFKKCAPVPSSFKGV